jgi:hypothetical protein
MKRLSPRRFSAGATPLIQILASLFYLVTLAPAKAVSVWDKYPRLVVAIDQVMKYSTRDIVPPAEELRELLQTACDTLTTLVDDPEFKADLDRALSKRVAQSGRLEELRRNLWLFTNQFISQERKLLYEQKPSLSEEAIGRILWSAAFFKDSITSAVDSTTVLSALDIFRKDVCEKTETTPTSDNSFVWDILTRVSGLVLIVVDTATESEGGLLATASVAIGTGMVQGQRR